VRDRLVELAEILAESAANDDCAGYRRADAELHALLLRTTENRMLEHLGAVVYGALEITDARTSGCAPGAEVDRHAALVDRILTGDGPAAAGILSDLLNPTSGSESSPYLPAQRDR
jgi:DNA-binding FadR family transcriptional regulator